MNAFGANEGDTPISPDVLAAVRNRSWLKDLPARVMEHMAHLANSRVEGNEQVTRLEHSLQTATLAQQHGEDEEYVVCALIHDIGDLLAPYNHGEFAAAMLQPYISEPNFWMVENHHVFQGYHYFHRLGLDRNLREQHRGHPHFQRTLDFCEKYDMPAFDPNMKYMSLADLAPMVNRLFHTPRHSIYVRRA
jgi:predicted HD phosphohydrolase